MITATLLAVELIVGAGTAHWSECGTNGCWRQPPLPYTYQLDTHQQKVGVRVGSVEIAYRNMGKASVRGTFVADDAYDSDRAVVQWGNRTPQYIDAEAVQSTHGVSVMYAPRFHAYGNFAIQPSVGLLWNRQRERITWFNADGSVQSSSDFLNSGSVTPIAGLALLYSFDKHWTAGASYEAAWRPRFRDSVAGGGSEHPVGMRMLSAELRYAW